MNDSERLQLLIDQGIITEEQLREVEMKDFNSLQQLADMMHSLMCREEHPYDCLWYEEDNMVDCWERLMHTSWLQKAKEACQINDMPPAQVLEALRVAGRAFNLLTSPPVYEAGLHHPAIYFLQDLLASRG